MTSWKSPQLHGKSIDCIYILGTSYWKWNQHFDKSTKGYSSWVSQHEFHVPEYILWNSGHWPISAICLLPKEFSVINWKLQMSSPCTKVMILCCLIITDLFLYCVFSQMFLKKSCLIEFQPSWNFLRYYMKINMAFEKIIYPFDIAFIYR